MGEHDLIRVTFTDERGDSLVFLLVPLRDFAHGALIRLTVRRHALASQDNLAGAYRAAGRTAEAIALHEQNLADTERVLGPDHPGTLQSRDNLALSYHVAGRIAETIALHERNLADMERVLGPDHPGTLQSRGNLAVAYENAGRSAEALPLHERTLADMERLLGPDHPGTLMARRNLDRAYQQDAGAPSRRRRWGLRRTR